MLDDARQLSLVDGRTPEAIVAAALAEHRPIATYCLFSGGGDSLITAHRCREHYDALVHIDTGTALPGVRAFVERMAAELEKPLHILEQGFDSYRLLVAGGIDWQGNARKPLGFPGPAQHGTVYWALKKRPLREFVRLVKDGHPRAARVAFVTGVRRQESARRSSRAAVNREDSILFINPLIDWSAFDMRLYRERHSLPESDVTALLHRSGECNCGAFATPDEREMLRALWPAWYAERIGSLEDEVADLDVPVRLWGKGEGVAAAAGAMCTDCQLRLI